MTFRIAYAGFSLESVTAVRSISTPETFRSRLQRGTELLEGWKETNTVAGGVFDTLAAADDVAIVPLCQMVIGAYGPASDAAIDYITSEIVAEIRAAGPLDGLVLFLHGACWAPGYPDVERYVLQQVRAVLPDVPISLALDYHGNIDTTTFENVDAAVAYRNSPHTDMGETGMRATLALLRMLRTRERPAIAVCKPGILIPSIMSATALEPLATIIAEAREMEAAGDCDLNVMAGFSYADCPNTGMAVLALDWDGPEAAAAKARSLALRLHELRRSIAICIEVMDIEGAFADIAAAPAQGKPIILLEHADRMNDSTHLLRAILGRDLGRVNFPFLRDEETAAQACAAGAGADIDIRLAGRSSPEAGGPIEARAKVLWAGPKSYRTTGRVKHGEFVDLGPTALLDIQGVRVSVVSRSNFAIDGDPFYIFGETPEDYDVIVLRSKTHFRDFYEPAADRIIVVDTPDLGPADLDRIPFAQLDKTKVFPWCDSPELTN